MPQQELPKAWIEKIFTRLLVRYMSAWTNMLAGFDKNGIEMVKQDWARELAHMRPDAIAYCLDNLPADGPPKNVKAFMEIARSRPPKPEYLAIDRSVKADPQRLARELQRVVDGAASRDPMAWAADLQQRAERGEALSVAQRMALKAVANEEVMSDQDAGP